jgi:hypothetical protein
MTARRLTEAEKQEILELYRLPGETTSTLASRYGVSTSTVSRILKSSLPEAEYEALIQQKRSRSSVDEALSEAIAPEPMPETFETTEPIPISAQLELIQPPPEVVRPRPTIRRRTDKPVAAETEPPLDDAYPLQSASIPDAYIDPLEELLSGELLDQRELADLALVGTDDLDGDDLDDDDLDDDDLDGDDLDDDEDDLGDESLSLGSAVRVGTASLAGLVQVLPLSEAALPRTCYLVVDRSAELIAPPLSNFGDLGQIPPAEIEAKTLPVFDNHRIAKRYSNPRTQRVIKLPDSRILHKTSSHLKAKGITRLLIDGQVYSLTDLTDA